MPKLQDYQLILFDVDQTLTNSQREITPRLTQALAAIAAHKINLGVCTGRTYASLVNHLHGILNHFPPESVHVVAGGAQVVSTNGQVHWEKLLSDATAKDIIHHAEKFDGGFLISHSNKIYVNQKMRAYLAQRKDLHDLKVHDYHELADFATPLIPVFDAALEFYNYLNERDDINYKQMMTYTHINADITAKGVNKATGLTELCRVLNIPPTKIIGVGDSENDDEFLQMVGYRVAMGNATPYLKSIAHRVIGATDEDGLAIYLEGLVAGNEL